MHRSFCSKGPPGAACMPCILRGETFWVSKGAPKCQAYLLCKLAPLRSGIIVSTNRVALTRVRYIRRPADDIHCIKCSECRLLL